VNLLAYLSITLYLEQRHPMATISGTAPVSLPQTQPRVGGTDSDGDNDASKAAGGTLSTPVVSKPTETMGNNVNTFA
jgi:hypothetical protein